MIDYLLTSSLSLLLLFGFYKFGLENERLHRFKRFYLLGSLLFSALVPLISLPGWVDPDVVPLPALPPVPFAAGGVPTGPGAVSPVTTPVDAPFLRYAIGLYALVTAVLLLRFGVNGYRLVRQIARQPKHPFRGATLVLVPGTGSPYTFLRYLFVPEGPYRRGEIEDELFTHELAHIRQGHSFDVLLIELLRCVGWFNPVLGWMRRAMQLNHEFLADEAVNAAHHDVPQYQRLLLSQLTLAAPVRLTSTLTFQTTKQRFLMMTKRTSPARTGLAYAGTLLLVGVLTALLGSSTSAQTVPTSGAKKPIPSQPQTDVAEMERLYGDKLVRIRTSDGKQLQKKYSELTPEEKKWVSIVPPQPRRIPTESQFESWKNPKKYGIWVDGKRVRNFSGTSLKAGDIVAYSWSYVYENARQPEGYLYQMDLMTENGYQAQLKRRTENPFVVLWEDLPKSR